jgi:hypothetical protein
MELIRKYLYSRGPLSSEISLEGGLDAANATMSYDPRLAGEASFATGLGSWNRNDFVGDIWSYDCFGVFLAR